MKLNPFENYKAFYSRSKGTTRTVRDTYINQSIKKVEEVKKETKPEVEVKELTVEVKISGEPSLEGIETELTSSKRPRKKRKTNEES